MEFCGIVGFILFIILLYKFIEEDFFKLDIKYSLGKEIVFNFFFFEGLLFKVILGVVYKLLKKYLEWSEFLFYL